MTLEELNAKIAALETKASEAVATVEAGQASAEELTEVKALVNDQIMPEITSLREQKARTEQEEEVKALKNQFADLTSAIDELKKPSGDFVLGGKAESDDDEDPYTKGERSFFLDVTRANKGVQAARERLIDGWEVGQKALGDFAISEEGKAMTEGTNAQGGYLVRPQIERTIVQARELDNVLRALCSRLNVNTNSIQLDSLSLSTTAGWVAELATKPETTSVALASITANVFTAAGLATISNQLLADSNPAVDSLVTSDLIKRLVALEETAFLNGSGTGQPLGILNTPGLGATTLTDTGVSTTGGLLDAILDAIAAVQGGWGQPSAILMHPRTWTRILKDRDANGHYTIDPTTAFGGGYDPNTSRTAFNGPRQSLFGIPVVLSNRIPTNLGTGTNESRVVVGDFRECLILDRQGITVDESPHVYFTTNQTVFRAEERVGFTAARTPAALNVIGGAGLANG